MLSDPGRERGAVPRRPAARLVRARRSPPRLRVHAAVEVRAGGRPGRDRLRPADQHDRVGGRGVSGPAWSGPGPSPSSSCPPGPCCCSSTPPRPRCSPAARTRRQAVPRADRLVSARRGQRWPPTARCSTPNGRPPVRVPAPPVDPGGRLHRGRGRVHRGLPARLAGQEAAGEALAGGCRLARTRSASSARAPFCERSNHPSWPSFSRSTGASPWSPAGPRGSARDGRRRWPGPGARVVLVARDAGRAGRVGGRVARLRRWRAAWVSA